MASTRLHRTPAGAGNQVKWTFSTWFKLCPDPDTNYYYGQTIFSAYNDANNYTEIMLDNSGKIDYLNVTGGGVDARLTSSMLCRDIGAWYHMVFVWDSANASAGDRMKIYVNGTELVALDADSNPSSSLNSIMNSAVLTEVGAKNSSNYWCGKMAHTHFCDGYAYAASDFGEEDSTSKIWKAKSGPSVSYGTNGFFLKYASGAQGTDSSGQGNNMTVAGTLFSLKDNPDNNFCVMNSLDTYRPQMTYTNCNESVATNNATWSIASMTLENGLWYWEVQPTGSLGGGECLGFLDRTSIGTGDSPYNMSGNFGAVVRSGGDLYINSSNTTDLTPGGGDLWVADDVIGVYMDLEANKVYFAKNGTILNSGTGVTITAPSALTTEAYNYSMCGYTPIWGSSNTSATTGNFNFGGGYLGQTQLTGTTYADNNGEGTFKYSPNDGGAASFDSSAKNFLAICAKNLASQGG